MAPGRHKLLVAVDGSEQSLKVVRYVAGICAPDRIAATLFHVLSPVAESFWDIAEAPEAPGGPSGGEGLAGRRAVIEDFMEGARRVLLDRGFAPEAVRVVIQPRREGVARDIIAEARRGYRAVAAGKTGHNPIARLVMGSVASKLVTALAQTGLWLVEGQPECGRVLVCIDASPAFADVVEHVGCMLAGSPAAVTLFHAIRVPEPHRAAGAGLSRTGEAAAREIRAREAMVPVFAKAVAALEAAGIPSARLSVKVISGVATRGGTLFAQALAGGCGTIAVGRRGMSRVADFPIGRVPMKLVQLIRDQAAWLVNC